MNKYYTLYNTHYINKSKNYEASSYDTKDNTEKQSDNLKS